ENFDKAGAGGSQGGRSGIRAAVELSVLALRDARSKPELGMRRRGFITLLGGAAAWPIAAFAQQRLPRVRVLLHCPALPAANLQIAAELARIGYVEGRNIAYEIRSTEGDITRLPPLARELAAVRPEVVCTENPIHLDGGMESPKLAE